MELDHRNGKRKAKRIQRECRLPIHSMYKKKRKGTRVSTPKTKVPIYIYNIYRKIKYKDISRAKEDINAYEAIYDTRIYR